MTARATKTLLPEKGYAHREHRSKRGRRYNPSYKRSLQFKRKKEELKKRDLEEYTG